MDMNENPMHQENPNGGYQNETPPPYSGPVRVQVPQRDPESKRGLAIAAMVCGLISLIGLCCFGLGIFVAPVAIILGICALCLKQGGTGFSVTGIVTGALSLIMVGAVLFAFREILPYSDTIAADYSRLTMEQDSVFPEYEKNGTLPDYILKYTEDPYATFFEKYEITIYDVMDVLNEQHKNGTLTKMEYTIDETGSSSQKQETAPPEGYPNALLIPVG